MRWEPPTNGVVVVPTLDEQNLSKEQLLIPPGTEILVPPEDDVDHL
jgi:hypothetical protein